MAILFSIIIPVFNSEKYLLSSVESVLKQFFSKKKYEIILINDCSSDNSKLIIQNFKKKYRTIRVINNKRNYKVSYCRNIGIKKAKGKYIIFLDSDDELKKNSFNKIERLLSKYEYDLILCLQFKTNKSRINPKRLKQINNIDSFISYENKQHIYNPNCWNMILKKSFLEKKKLFFKKIDIFEDQVFCTEVLLAANNVKIIPNSFYNYIQRPLSLSRNTNYLALKSCLRVLINFLEILENSRLSNDKIFFIQDRINFIMKIFKHCITICSETQLEQIAFNFKRYSKKIKRKNNKLFKKLIESKKIFFEIKNLFELRNQLIFKIKNNSYYDYNKIYIFGFGIIGRTVFHVLKSNDVKIDGFIDNDKNLLGAIYLDKKIFNPKYLKSTINRKANNILVIICQNEKKASNEIIQQLKNIGSRNINIKIINTF